MDHVIWHDVECGGYAADLPLWRAFADEARGPVLDLGAGTGRVTLDLARRGHEVHALDLDAVLLGALAERARGLPVVTHLADARDFDLGRRFALAVAPMQTVQLLGGADGRAALLRAVHRHLEPGALLVAAIAHEVEAYEDTAVAPVPDLREVDGVVYASRPVAIRDDGAGIILERVRERVDSAGRRDVSGSRVRLDRMSVADLEREAREAGFTPQARRAVPATGEHVGSGVAVLRA